MAACIGNWQRELEKCLDTAKKDGLLEDFSKLQTGESRVRFMRQKELTKSIQWISFYFDNCNQLHQKSQEKASMFRKEGNSYFQKRQYVMAVQKYTEAILFAPPASEELPLGFSNKSAALFHLGEYQASLQDIELAIEMGFPRHSIHKLALRKVSCHHRLGCWKEAKSAAKDAEQMLHEGEITPDRKDRLLKELADLKQQIAKDEQIAIEKCKQLDDKDKVVLPELSYGPSETVVQASSAVTLQWSKQQGRHFVANHTIQPGDTLIVEKPFAAVLLPDHYPTHCNNCFQLLRNIVPCRRCCVVRYCSVQCRDQSWTSCHQIECPFTDLLHSVGIAHLSLRVILVAGLQFLTEFVKGQDHRESFTEATAGLDADGKYHHSYQTVYDLMTHSDDLCQEDLFQYSMTTALLLEILQHSGWFRGVKSSYISESLTADDNERVVADGKSDVINNHSDVTNGQQWKCGTKMEEETLALDQLTLENGCLSEKEDTAEKYYDLIGGLLLRHIQQLVCNAHAITELKVSSAIQGSMVEEKSQVRVATAIYPTASLMNHSCDPTIISSFHKDTLVVKAVKDVKPGEEIFTCYGPHHLRMSWRQRQEELKQQYFFTCHCAPCTSGQGDEQKLYALRCSSCTGPMIDRGDNLYRCQGCSHTSQCVSELQQLKVADDLFQTGLQLLNQGQFKGALDKLQSGYNIGHKVMYQHNKHLSDMEDCIARCFASIGQFRDAAEYLRKSIVTVREIFGPSSIELANELQKLSEVLVSGQQWSEALMVTNTAIDIFTTQYGSSHDTVLHLINLRHELEEVNKCNS